MCTDFKENGPMAIVAANDYEAQSQSHYGPLASGLTMLT
jgi:hypothetical protein